MAVTDGSQQGHVKVTGVRVLGRQSMCLDKYKGSRPSLQGGLGRVRGKRSGPPTLVLRIRVAKQGGEVGLDEFRHFHITTSRPGSKRSGRVCSSEERGGHGIWPRST